MEGPHGPLGDLYGPLWVSRGPHRLHGPLRGSHGPLESPMAPVCLYGPQGAPRASVLMGPRNQQHCQYACYYIIIHKVLLRNVVGRLLFMSISSTSKKREEGYAIYQHQILSLKIYDIQICINAKTESFNLGWFLKNSDQN